MYTGPSRNREKGFFLSKGPSMSSMETPDTQTATLLQADAMATAIQRIADEIMASNPDIGGVVFLGILKRGRPLAERMADRIGEKTGFRPPVGSLATTLYRDDLRAGVGHVKFDGGATHFDFPIDDKTVILVDDVLAAGRTIRAAMDEVMDYGRPARIQLACLIDRGGRELPIQPDYLGKKVKVAQGEYVAVRMTETDGQDVVLRTRKETQQPTQGGA